MSIAALIHRHFRCHQLPHYQLHRFYNNLSEYFDRFHRRKLSGGVSIELSVIIYHLPKPRLPEIKLACQSFFQKKSNSSFTGASCFYLSTQRLFAVSLKCRSGREVFSSRLRPRGALPRQAELSAPTRAARS